MRRKQRDVNRDKKIILRKVVVEAENREIRKNLGKFSTERKFIKVFLGTDSQQKFN